MRKEHGIVIVRTLPIVVGIIATLASGCGSNDAAQSATPTTTATTSTDATANKSLLTSYTGSNSATV
ncbi:MAG: hypothetical protein HYV03_02505 [Deltaproteobacteria bacterium]|nr:hypothetical protein [Deltaproteobacteria bacterium]